MTGLAVVVAEKDGHVALYRGATRLGEPEPNKPAAAPAMDPRRALDEKLRQNEAEEESYKGNIRKKQGGVEMKETGK